MEQEQAEVHQEGTESPPDIMVTEIQIPGEAIQNAPADHKQEQDGVHLFEATLLEPEQQMGGIYRPLSEGTQTGQHEGDASSPPPAVEGDASSPPPAIEGDASSPSGKLLSVQPKNKAQVDKTELSQETSVFHKPIVSLDVCGAFGEATDENLQRIRSSRELPDIEDSESLPVPEIGKQLSTKRVSFNFSDPVEVAVLLPPKRKKSCRKRQHSPELSDPGEPDFSDPTELLNYEKPEGGGNQAVVVPEPILPGERNENQAVVAEIHLPGERNEDALLPDARNRDEELEEPIGPLPDARMQDQEAIVPCPAPHAVAYRRRNGRDYIEFHYNF